MDVRRNEEVEIPMPINSSYPVGHGRGHVHLHHQHLTNIVSSLPPPPSIQSPDPPLTDAEPVSSRTTGGRMIPGTAAATGNLVIIHEIENNHHNKSIQNHDDDDNNNKAAAVPVSSNTVRYRECLKNHAATMGGNATDGCGEFMPLGEDGTMEALICSACNCHRNFHRKEVDHHHHHDPPPPLNLTQQYYYYNHDNDIRHRKAANGRTKKKMSGSNEFYTTKSSSSLLFPTMNISIPYLSPSDSSHVQHQLGNGSTTAELANYRSGLTGIFPPAAAPSLSSPVQVNHHRHHHHRQMMMKKRYRTKFTAEQKEKMLRFAERVEWKLQKQEESVVQQFCQEIGVKRKVLKVWMHNNKHNFSNKMVNNNGSSNPTATTTTTTTNVNVMISNNTD